MSELTITSICRLLEAHGNQCLQPSPVTLIQHAQQTAWLAERARASNSLICACLLHDLGHLVMELEGAGTDEPRHGHDHHGAARLSELFGPDVTEPIRLHVHAKRYLCYAHPGYSHGLSVHARRSLERQGGTFTAPEARAFMQEPYAIDAVNLRLWDDQAHQPDIATPGLAHFAATLRTCVLPKREPTLARARG